MYIYIYIHEWCFWSRKNSMSPKKTSPRWASYLLTSVILLTAVGLLRDPGEDAWDDLSMWDTKGYQWLPYFQTLDVRELPFFFFLRSRFLEAHTLKIFEVWKMIAPWLTPFPAPTWVQKPQVSREYLRNKHRSLPIYQSTSNMLVTVDSSPRSPDHDALGIDARIQHDTRCMSLAVGTAPRSFRVMGK